MTALKKAKLAEALQFYGLNPNEWRVDTVKPISRFQKKRQAIITNLNNPDLHFFGYWELLKNNKSAWLDIEILETA